MINFFFSERKNIFISIFSISTTTILEYNFFSSIFVLGLKISMCYFIKSLNKYILSTMKMLLLLNVNYIKKDLEVWSLKCKFMIWYDFSIYKRYLCVCFLLVFGLSTSFFSFFYENIYIDIFIVWNVIFFCTLWIWWWCLCIYIYIRHNKKTFLIEKDLNKEKERVKNLIRITINFVSLSHISVDCQ